ncbi:MAG: UTP--glucose-1-phosphate uridylyltransferase [Syntrophomonadaceae bacterium]|nr:UTP--glucose-1-phosphate uridylyltransferase [Bacillota bacterium]
MRRVRKAIIPAAGLGTRFLPATKAQPKEMLPIVDKPTIQYIVEEAINSGIEDIIIVTGRGKRAIEDHFDRSVELEAALQAKGDGELLELVNNISLVDIHYVRQKEPKGLGHAVWCARKFIAKARRIGRRAVETVKRKYDFAIVGQQLENLLVMEYSLDNLKRKP